MILTTLRTHSSPGLLGLLSFGAHQRPGDELEHRGDRDGCVNPTGARIIRHVETFESRFDVDLWTAFWDQKVADTQLLKQHSGLDSGHQYREEATYEGLGLSALNGKGTEWIGCKYGRSSRRARSQKHRQKVDSKHNAERPRRPCKKEICDWQTNV